MNHNNSTTEQRRSVVGEIAGFVLIAVIILALGSTLIYKFFERLSPEGRMDALVLLVWALPIGFLLGLAIGVVYARGFRSGNEHSAMLLTATPRPVEQPPAQTVIEYPQGWADEPRPWNPDESANIIRQLEARG